MQRGVDAVTRPFISLSALPFGRDLQQHALRFRPGQGIGRQLPQAPSLRNSP